MTQFRPMPGSCNFCITHLLLFRSTVAAAVAGDNDLYSNDISPDQTRFNWIFFQPLLTDADISAHLHLSGHPTGYRYMRHFRSDSTHFEVFWARECPSERLHSSKLVVEMMFLILKYTTYPSYRSAWPRASVRLGPVEPYELSHVFNFSASLFLSHRG